jgi:hypothetical protein
MFHNNIRNHTEWSKIRSDITQTINCDIWFYFGPFSVISDFILDLSVWYLILFWTILCDIWFYFGPFSVISDFILNDSEWYLILFWIILCNIWSYFGPICVISDFILDYILHIIVQNKIKPHREWSKIRSDIT